MEKVKNSKEKNPEKSFEMLQHQTFLQSCQGAE